MLDDKSVTSYHVMHDYLYGTELETYSFFRIPKALFEHPLYSGMSAEAKLLYGCFLDRASLSSVNDWKDNQGRIFIVFQFAAKRFHIHYIIKMSVGFLYTYIGLVLFLTGANVGFMPAGRLIGAKIAEGAFKNLLIPIGMIMGYFVVSAEPAVHTLKRQVSEITNGAISQKSVAVALSIGVSVSVGISMLRVLTGMPIMPFLIFGYAISLVIGYFVPNIYTGIAFDSGGVASGPMTSTFMLPFAMGACEAVGGNIMTDAFGIVAMIAMTPLITIQTLGLYERRKRARMIKKLHTEISMIEDDIIFFDEEERVYE